MESTLIQLWQRFVNEYRVKSSEDLLSELALDSILKHGRLPNTNNFPPLHKFGITFKAGADVEIPYTHYGLGRKFKIINTKLYQQLINAFLEVWNFRKEEYEYTGIESLFLSNEKVIPVYAMTIFSMISDINIISGLENNASNLVNRKSIMQFVDFQYKLFIESDKYEYLLETDVFNFYKSIYVHAIPWALATKQAIKSAIENKTYRKTYKNYTNWRGPSKKHKTWKLWGYQSDLSPQIC